MQMVIRALLVYGFLLVVLRVSGKRTLSQTTPFEFVLLLIISETVQQAMVGDDQSLTGAALLVLTLVGTSIVLSLVKQASPRIDKWLDGVPLIIVENGKMLRGRMRKSRIDEADILESARMLQGLERLDQIEYAVVERSGEISIIPKS